MESKCINCLANLTSKDCRLQDTFDFERKKFTKPASGSGRLRKLKMRSRPPLASKRVQEIDTDVLQIMNLIFQHDFYLVADHGQPDPLSSDYYGLCFTCASILGQLFHDYLRFVSMAKLSSYVHGILQRMDSFQRILGKYLSESTRIEDKLKADNEDEDRSTWPTGTNCSHSDLNNQQDTSPCLVTTTTSGSKNEFHDAMRPRPDDTVDSSVRKFHEIQMPKLVLERLKLDIKVEPLDELPVSEALNEETAEFDLEVTNSVEVPTTKKHKRKPSNVSKRKYTRRIRSESDPPLPSTWKSKIQFSPCKKCCEEFNYKSHLRIHMNTHAEAEASKDKCPICVCWFKTHLQLRTHMRKAHPDSPVPWATGMGTSATTFSDFCCTLCKAKFMYCGRLRRHMVEKHFHCQICEVDYATADLVNAHMQMHGSHWSRPFQVCELCGYKVDRPRLLRRHKILVHSEAGPVSCHICGKNFDSGDSLTKHKRVHNIERPYKCDRCPMTYKYLSNLRTHKLTAHEGIIFVCDICGHASTSASNLRKHVAGIHQGIRQEQKRTPNEVKRKRLNKKDLMVMGADSNIQTYNVK